ncbi:MAG: excinuclease ABC subunit UvrA [Christensenellales bacterium]|jgi:excinuclease ABC subunit A|nr:excinuclease ABC subunit UvrA [Clostridiales bacterium]
MNDKIIIKGAKENNLKDINLTLPRDKFIVFTGLSGSGKSSLAFDTIFAEGQRRYIESLSSYARQFLGQMDKPDVESIEGLSPSISIDQKTTSHNPRSTVGTVTEIYDYLRLLFARIGVPHCPECGREIYGITVDQIVDKALMYAQGTKIMVMAPIVRGRKGEYKKQFENLRKDGYARVKVDGEIRMLDEDIELDRQRKHDISVVVDRLIIKEGINRRLTDSVELALKLTGGLVSIDYEGKEELYSTRYACPDCNITLGEITPRSFSFNSPYGACPECTGLGFKNEIDIDKLIPDKTKSLREGAIKVSGWNLDMGRISAMMFKALSEKYKFSLDTPYKDLPKHIQDMILYGNNRETMRMEWQSARFSAEYNSSYEGIVNNLKRRYRETASEGVKRDIERLMTTRPCMSCSGKRLTKEVLSIRIDGRNISEVADMPISRLPVFFGSLKLSKRDAIVATPILKELNERVNFLIDVGLGYLTLSRSSATLSGGEAQRIRLATQIGSGLMGVIYILDEPSIGLHQRDNGRLIATLKKLRDVGNTLIVVEHDEETIREADYIVDIGPGAGIKGGEVVAAGSPADIMNNEKSLTGLFLSGKRKIALPEKRRDCCNKYLSVLGARQNNLKNINVDFPLGCFDVVTGVSGSGKSSLVNGILYPHLANKLNGARLDEGDFDEIEGMEHCDKVIAIDQSPIGRTPRSNPATYTGVFTYIRELFSSTPEARARGYREGRFSFNVSGGRCENCKGDGIIKIEMHFLPDVYVPCEVCRGRRYNRETLEVKYKGKSIYDILEMTVDEACEFFSKIPRIFNKLKTIQDVGLGYIKLGQPATTFSGGEAQRIKLAAELSKRATGRTVYILDEPTTGLHAADVEKLIMVLQRLVDSGNTVIIIEHNIDVIKTADYVIDLGPEGGDLGGNLIAKGRPEQVAATPGSYTGEYLKKVLYK